MNKFAEHYITSFLKHGGQLNALMEMLGHPATRATVGAGLGTGVAGVEQHYVDQTLDAAGIDKISPYGKAVSYGTNAALGAAMMFPAGRRAIKPMTAIGTQLMQPGLMVSDRGAKMFSNLSDASSHATDAVIDAQAKLNGPDGLLTRGSHAVGQADKIISAPATQKQIQGAIASGTGAIQSVQGAADKANSIIPDVRAIQDSVPEIRDAMKSFGRAVDPKWMIGTTAALGVPWVGYELWKRNEAKKKQLASDKKQERLMSSLDRIAGRLDQKPLAAPL